MMVFPGHLCSEIHPLPVAVIFVYSLLSCCHGDCLFSLPVTRTNCLVAWHKFFSLRLFYTYPKCISQSVIAFECRCVASENPVGAAVTMARCDNEQSKSKNQLVLTSSRISSATFPVYISPTAEDDLVQNITSWPDDNCLRLTKKSGIKAALFHVSNADKTLDWKQIKQLWA